ncbi:MAG TPA: hypothetical protein VMH20_08880 [Verrucomicrobiae bacterium]|nr:hypothetical protein [Verrucomicrobiae bacterium]
MPSSSERNKRPFFLRWCVPLLLIGLLLYNPFLALLSHSPGLGYQAMERHRATVGSSELLHYTPVQWESAQPEAIVEAIFAGLQAEKSKYPTYTPQDETLAQRVELIASIWFRPPPAR